jgi:transmembrane sensor
LEKPIKQLFIDFIEDRCAQQEIEQVKKLLAEQAHEEQWLQAMEETERRMTEKTTAAREAFPETTVTPDLNEGQLLKRIQRSAGIPAPVKTYTWIAYAAVFLLLVSAGLIFLKSPDQTRTAPLVENKKISTPKKDSVHKWIKLPDGTSVQLNADSHLNYPHSFAGLKTREVSLTGEAYFDVKHDAAHPFIIRTGKIKTTVLGTAFNISAYSADVAVTITVTRGKVMVQEGNKTLAVLTPDQQLAWNSAQPPVKVSLNAESAIAWKKSDLIMDDITLAEAAKMISARYGLQVQFKNDKVKDCRFTAAFLNSNQIDQVLNVLGDITGANLILKDHTITIDGPGC